MADYDNPIRHIQRILKEVLNGYICKNRFPFIIKNTKPVIDFCENFKLLKEHELITMDYASMYTNINLRDFCSIIEQEYELFNIYEKYFISGILHIYPI